MFLVSCFYFKPIYNIHCMNFKIRRFIGQIIERNKDGSDISFGKGDIIIQILIVMSLITFAVETLPNLGYYTKQFLRYFEVFCISVFTFEFLIRLYFSKPKGKYLFSFFGIIDLVAILPFYLSSGVDLRSARAFRLLRLFRILKLARYNTAIKRFNQAFIIAKEELILFSAVALILLYLSSVGIYYFENEAQPELFTSVFHSFWWAIATLTTVGYGDIYPVTTGGKIFTFFVLMVGLGLVAVPTGLIASALSDARKITENDDANL